MKRNAHYIKDIIPIKNKKWQEIIYFDC